MESIICEVERGLSVFRLIELIGYDPETGELWRLIGIGRQQTDLCLTSSNIKIDGIEHRAPRLAWAIYHSSRPPPGMWVDHKDGIKSNNRISNLRLATPTQNQQNKAGYGSYSKGVTWRPRYRKPYQAKIRVNGVRLHLGSFATEAEAAIAYQDACLKYHGEFACPT
jgi:hypothetical protein